jgi:DNA-binding transcriptional ArsR family regulator
MPGDSLTRTFSALADPTRRAILERLARGHAVVKEIAQPFGISSPAISKHLRVLERAGLIEQGRYAQWRPRRLLGKPLHEAADWLQNYRPFWEAQFDRMEEVLQRIKAEDPTKPEPAAKADQGNPRKRPPRKPPP